MPIAAVPAYLGRDFSDASPGMRFGMYLPLWGVNKRTKEYLWTTHDIDYQVRGQNQQEREVREENKVSALSAAKRLTERDQQTIRALLQRQQQSFTVSISDAEGLKLEAHAAAPFTTGLGNEHPLENGFAFLNPYGLPYLPGSGVKGVLRQAARELASGDWGIEHGWQNDEPFGPTIKQQRIPLSMLDALFGLESTPSVTQHVRGALTFWDVIPQIKGDSLTVEIMTPHQSHYYQQKNDRKAGNSYSPHESGQPNPISFLTVPPGSAFHFHVQCDLAHLNRIAPQLTVDFHWKTLLTAAFEHAFKWLGFGAKTAVGYGAMLSVAQQQRQKTQVEERKAQQKLAEQEAATKRQEATAVAWAGARIKFNRGNGSLSVEKDGKTAIALEPKGIELLNTLPAESRKKIESNQYVKVIGYVAEGVLIRVEPN